MACCVVILSTQQSRSIIEASISNTSLDSSNIWLFRSLYKREIFVRKCKRFFIKPLTAVTARVVLEEILNQC